MTVEQWADAVGAHLARISPGAPLSERVAPMMQMALAAAAAGNYVSRSTAPRRCRWCVC